MREFLSLPNELILAITENLPLRDICALLQTNHRLSDLLKDTLLMRLIRSRSLTYGSRLLYQLASRQDQIGVKYVIDRGILDFTDPKTLMHRAVRTQSVHVLETLLHFSLGTNTKDRKGRTPLGISAKHGRVDFVRVLSASDDVDVNSVNDKSMTPLFLAVQAGQEEAVQILTQSANINLQHVSNYTMGNCLHLAAEGECVAILRFLLDYLDPNQEDDGGNTVLHTAVGSGNRLAVECLLEDERVDVNALNIMRETVLHLAILSHEYDIVKILLTDSRVEINIRDDHGKTPLDMAVTSRLVDIVGMILSSPKADVNPLDR